MTRKELKAHCIRQVEQCERWAKLKGEEPSGKVYEEHKLILELLEQEPKWIPCSEMLPEEETDVLICNRNGDIALSRGSYSTEVENDFIWYTSGWRFGKVIAWMPLPKPYEPQESEESDICGKLQSYERAKAQYTEKLNGIRSIEADKDKIIEKTEQWAKKAEEVGMTLTEYFESISPLNNSEDKE